MANTLQIKRNTSGVPSGLEAGELAVNLTDKKLYVGNAAADGVLQLNEHLPLAGGELSGGLTIATANELAFGDSNTRILGSSGSDYLRFDPDGSEGMRLTATGLGIGTAAPTQKLDVVGGHIRMDSGMSLQWDNSHERIEALNSGIIKFFTNNGQAMTLKGSSLGIGVDDPAVKLDVDGSLNLKSEYNLTWGGTAGANIPLIYGKAGSGGHLAFHSQGTDGESMRIDANGRLGINTVSPDYKLHVAGDYIFTDIGKGLRLGGSSHQVVREDTNELRIKAASAAGYTTFYTGDGGETMRLDSEGRLGIKVTPSAWHSTYNVLQIGYGGSVARWGNSNDGDLSLYNNAYYGTVSGDTDYKYTSNGGACRYYMTDTKHVFQTAGSGSANDTVDFSDILTINSDGTTKLAGNVGIGMTPNASYPLVVNTATDWPVGFYRGGTSEWWFKIPSDGSFSIHEAAGGDRLSVATGGTVTVGGNLTVGGSCTLAAISGTSATFSGSVSLYNGSNLAGRFEVDSGLDTYINSYGSGNFIKFKQNNADILTLFETFISIPDSKELRFGDGSDLRIRHNGTDSYIDDVGTGRLLIRSNHVRIGKYTGEEMIDAYADGAVKLYHDNVVRLETYTSGAIVTGQLGIGLTPSAEQKLHIRCTTDVNLAIGNASGSVKFNALNDAVTANVPMEFGASLFKLVGGNVLVGSLTTTQKVTKFSGNSTGITIGGATPTLALWDTDNADHVTYVANAGGNGYLGTATASPIYFQPGGVTELTLEAGVLNFTRTADEGERSLMVRNSNTTLFVGVEKEENGNRFSGSSSDNAFIGTTSNDGLEFGTNNSVRGVITAGGNWGLGTTAPSSKLHVDGGDIKLSYTSGTNPFTLRAINDAFWMIGDNAATQEWVMSRAYSHDDAFHFRYAPGTTGAGAGIMKIGQQSKNHANYTHGITAFYTNGIEAMRIGPDRKVGIGTSSPGGTLHTVALPGTTGLMTVGATGNNIAQFYTSGSATVMVLDSDGNVGIGETSPVGGLVVRTDDVDATASANVSQYSLNIHGNGVSDGEEIGLALTAWASGGSLTTGYTPGAAIVHERSGSNSKGHLHFRVKGSTTANAALTTAMTILDNGKVAIGTAAPNGTLDVAATGNETNPTIQVGYSTSSRANYRFGLYSDSETGYLSNKNGNNGIRFVHRGGTVMQVGYGGDASTPYVGIGDSAPSSLLTLKATEDGAEDIFAIKADDNGNLFRVGKDSNDHGYVELFDGASTPIKVRFNSSGSSYFNGGGLAIGSTDPGTHGLYVYGTTLLKNTVQCDDTLTVGSTLSGTSATFTGNVFVSGSIGAGTTVDTDYKIKAGGHVNVVGNLYCWTLYESSDYRLKESVSPWNVSTASSLVQSLPVYSYRWNDKSESRESQTQDRVGFLAHEAAEKIQINNLVDGEKDGERYQRLAHSEMVPILWAALQDALKRIEELEAKA